MVLFCLFAAWQITEARGHVILLSALSTFSSTLLYPSKAKNRYKNPPLISSSCCSFFSHPPSFSSEFFFFLRKNTALALSIFLSMLLSTSDTLMLAPLYYWNSMIWVLHLISIFQWFCPLGCTVKVDCCFALNFYFPDRQNSPPTPIFFLFLGSLQSISGLLSLHSSLKCCSPGMLLPILPHTTQSLLVTLHTHEVNDSHWLYRNFQTGILKP